MLKDSLIYNSQDGAESSDGKCEIFNMESCLSPKGIFKFSLLLSLCCAIREMYVVERKEEKETDVGRNPCRCVVKLIRNTVCKQEQNICKYPVGKRRLFGVPNVLKYLF